MPRLFISYRRSDSEAISGHIADRLKRLLGNSKVFFDVKDISAGEVFPQKLREAITTADVVLIIIGRTWTTVRDSNNNRRIDDPRDFVRQEARIALEEMERHGKRVIPVLVDDAPFPARNELPEDIRQLADLNAVKVRSGSDFDTDIQKLKEAVTPRRSRVPWVILILAGVAITVAGILILTDKDNPSSAHNNSPTITETLTDTPTSSHTSTAILSETPSFFDTPTDAPASTIEILSDTLVPTNTAMFTLTPSETATLTLTRTPTPPSLIMPSPTRTTMVSTQSPTLSEPNGYPCPATITTERAPELRIVRSQPSSTAALMPSVRAGRTVVVMDKLVRSTVEVWYQIGDAENNNTLGWILSDYLVLDDTCPQ